jgi:hypothetical protein
MGKRMDLKEKTIRVFNGFNKKILCNCNPKGVQRVSYQESNNGLL